MPHIMIPAPAKLNLHLKIGGSRPDGFHEIQSLFCALAFGDTLSFETAPEPLSLEIAMECPSLIPPEQNIISRAVSLFRSRTGYNEGLNIKVEKRIPLGGGLGGGSSNAAAVLLALNHLASIAEKPPVNAANLIEMGAVLGSDVPFFLYNTAAAWVSGRGEIVEPLELPESFRSLFLVLVNPGFSSNTAEAFHLLSKHRQFIPSFSKKNKFSWQILSHSPHDWPFSNDFLTVFQDFSESGTAYKQIIFSLQELGADFSGLSGSGSTCFGVFSGRDTAEQAQKSLLKRWPFVIFTFFACALDNTILQ